MKTAKWTLALAAALLAGGAYAQTNNSGAKLPALGGNNPITNNTDGGNDGEKRSLSLPRAGDDNASARAAPMGDALKQIGITTNVDRDDNGRITKAEASLDRTLESRFGKLDLNSDGVLTREEIAGNVGVGAQANNPAAGREGRAGQFDFARLDVNSDGKISKTEAKLEPKLNAGFKKADSDNDGDLSKSEIENGFKDAIQ